MKIVKYDRSSVTIIETQSKPYESIPKKTQMINSPPCLLRRLRLDLEAIIDTGSVVSFMVVDKERGISMKTTFFQTQTTNENL